MSEPNDHRPQRRTKAGRLVSSITKEELEALYHLPSEKACKELGVGLTILKRICRKLGIPRWPYNRVPKAQQNPGGHPAESSSLNSRRSADPPASEAAAASNYDHHAAASPTAANRLAQLQLSSLLQQVAGGAGRVGTPPAVALPTGTQAGAGTSGPYPNPALLAQLLSLLQQQQQQAAACPAGAAAGALAGGAAASRLGQLFGILEGASLPGMQPEGEELLSIHRSAGQLSSESVMTSAPLGAALEAPLSAPQSLPQARPAPLALPLLPLLPLQQQAPPPPQLQVPELQQLLAMLGGLPAAPPAPQQGLQPLPAPGNMAAAVMALQQEQLQHLERQQQQGQAQGQGQRQIEEAVELLHSMLCQRGAAGASPTNRSTGDHNGRSPLVAEGAAGGAGVNRPGPQHSGLLEEAGGGIVRPKALSLPLLSSLNAGLASQLTQNLIHQGSTGAMLQRTMGPQHAQQPLQLYHPSRAPSATTWPTPAPAPGLATTGGFAPFHAAAAAAQQAQQQQRQAQGQVDVLALLIQQVSALVEQQQEGQQQQQQQQQPHPGA